MSFQGISTEILQCFEQKTQITDSFNSVEVKFNNSQISKIFTISFQGPFILLQQGQNTQFSIFIHIFTPNLERDKVSITLRLLSNPNHCHILKFSSTEDATTFRNDCFTIERLFQTFCLESLDITQCTFTSNYMVLLPGSKLPAYLPVAIQIKKEGNTSKAFFKITAPNEANKKKKKDKNDKPNIDLSFELKAYPILEAMQPYQVPRELGNSGFNLVSVELHPNTNDTYYIVTRTKEEAMSTIMSISAFCLKNGDFSPPKAPISKQRPQSAPTIESQSLDSKPPLKETETAPSSQPGQEKVQQIDEAKITRHRHHSTVLIQKPTPKQTIADTNIRNGASKRANTHKPMFETPAMSANDILLNEIDAILKMKDQENKHYHDSVNTARLTKSRTNTLSKRKNTASNYTSLSEFQTRKSTFKAKDFAHIYIEAQDSVPLISHFELPETNKTSLITQENRIDSLNQYEQMLAPIEEEINVINETQSKLQKDNENDAVLPDFETFIADHFITKVDIDQSPEMTSNFQLEKCLESLDSYEDNFLNIRESSEDKTTDTIVQESIELLSHPWDEKSGEEILSSICDINSIASSHSRLNFMEFTTSESPKSLIMDELINVTQAINLSGLNKIYIDSVGTNNEKIGQQLLALIATIFLNGQREFQKIHDLSSNDLDLLSSFANEIHTFVCSMEDMKTIDSTISKISKPQEQTGVIYDIGTVSIVMASLFLNTGVLIEFLRGVQKNDNWVNRYYLPTSFLASNEMVQLSIAVLTPLFRTKEFFFDMAPSSNVLLNQSQQFIDTMVKIPTQGYLEVDPQILNSVYVSSNMKFLSVLSSSTIISLDSSTMLSSSSGIYKDKGRMRISSHFYESAIQHQFDYFLRPSFRGSLFSDAQREFQFICDAASTSYNIDGWDVFVDFTKNLKNSSNMKTRNSLINEWIGKGLEKQVIHKWILFLALDQDLVKKYYYDGSLFLDPFKLKYTIRCIESTYSQLF